MAEPAIKWDMEAEHDLWRALMAPNSWHGDDGETPTTHPDALWAFVNKGWGAEFFLKGHPEVPQWLYEPIHRKFCAWLQLHLLRWKELAKTGLPGRYHIACVLPRGYGKTVSATKAGSVWTHLDEPDMSTLYCSATADLTEDILMAVRGVIGDDDEYSWFPWLYGNWKQGNSAWTKKWVTHGRRTGNLSEPSFDTASVDTGMTGYHHRQHVWDDPITKNKLRDGRDAYMRAVHDAVDATFNACQSNGLVELVLTRYLDDDVAGRHFKDQGIASWDGMECPNISAVTEKIEWGKGLWHVFFFQTEDELTGEPTHPGLWTKEMIADAKKRDGEDFACQQQNNPGSGEHAPLLESQVPYLYTSYQDFLWKVPIKWATIHIDTAFKRPETVRTGDDNAIVVWLADARDNGMMYLDTELLIASNEWREEQFNKELVRVCLNLRRRGIWIRAITDETEPGGKAGTYKNRILGVLGAAGIELGPDQFIVLNRKIEKTARIRTGAGVWAEGYVRILLWQDERTLDWKVPPVFRKLVSQIVRVDVVTHDDLADAATDGFIPQLWSRPLTNPGLIRDEGTVGRRPGDEELKSFGQRPTDLELLEMIDAQKEMEREGRADGVRGMSDPFGLSSGDIDRSPV